MFAWDSAGDQPWCPGPLGFFSHWSWMPADISVWESYFHKTLWENDIVDEWTTGGVFHLMFPMPTWRALETSAERNSLGRCIQCSPSLWPWKTIVYVIPVDWVPYIWNPWDLRCPRFEGHLPNSEYLHIPNGTSWMGHKSKLEFCLCHEHLTHIA